MGITDWNKWLKDHRIYIPTAEEIEKAKEQNRVKIERIKKDCENTGKALESYRKKVEASR